MESIPVKQELKDKFNSGLSQRQLASLYGVSRATVRKWFKIYNIVATTNEKHSSGGAPKGSGWKNLYSKDELWRAYNKPMSMRSIADFYKTTECKVRRDFSKWGLKARKPARQKTLTDDERLQNLKKSRKKWVANNKDKKLGYTRKWKDKQMRENIDYRLLHNLRSRAYKALISGTKNKSKLVGCSGIELRDHLESLFEEGMTWDNYGYRGWHVDHVVPCSSFDLQDPAQQQKCFHYTNLQPLWAKENFAKSDSIDWEPPS
jgi:transposase